MQFRALEQYVSRNAGRLCLADFACHTHFTRQMDGFLAQPERRVFLKPNVTRVAAENYGFDFRYASKPSWSGYANLLEFASLVRRDLRDLRPRDMIDIQSFIWVLGSDEYS
jgi:hypothetical protein